MNTPFQTYSSHNPDLFFSVTIDGAVAIAAAGVDDALVSANAVDCAAGADAASAGVGAVSGDAVESVVDTGAACAVDAAGDADDRQQLSDQDLEELLETCLQLMAEFVDTHPDQVIEENFEDRMETQIRHLVYLTLGWEAEWESEQKDEEVDEERAVMEAFVAQHCTLATAPTLFRKINAELRETVNECVEHAMEIFFSSIMPPRAHPTTFVREEGGDKEDNEGTPAQGAASAAAVVARRRAIAATLRKLRAMPQPAQRTPEWYEFRHGLITASNAYKAFGSQAMQNQLIYEKCKPQQEQWGGGTGTSAGAGASKEVHMVNTTTTLHWGQKYEPVSIEFYERWFKTRVGEFGCIRHDTYSFLGASPDGINVDPTSSRYGRALEIKNIVNREITGIPKKEYWVQMQLQMEVCDLDDCDFLETRFVEYPSHNAFVEDSAYGRDNDGDNADVDHVSGLDIDIDLSRSRDGKLKGSMLHFYNPETGEPFYVRKPIVITHRDESEHWEKTQMEVYLAAPYNYVFVNYIYWKLAEWSCVLVERNRAWFVSAVPTLSAIWATIEKERVEGYAHREPLKRTAAKAALVVAQQPPPPSRPVPLIRWKSPSSATRPPPLPMPTAHACSAFASPPSPSQLPPPSPSWKMLPQQQQQQPRCWLDTRAPPAAFSSSSALFTKVVKLP